MISQDRICLSSPKAFIFTNPLFPKLIRKEQMIAHPGFLRLDRIYLKYGKISCLKITKNCQFFEDNINALGSTLNDAQLI